MQSMTKLYDEGNWTSQRVVESSHPIPGGITGLPCSLGDINTGI
jgi:hypothetical protein